MQIGSSSSDKDTLRDSDDSDLMQKIGPEVSIIPVERKRASFKIRLFNKEYSPTDDAPDTVQIFSR